MARGKATSKAFKAADTIPAAANTEAYQFPEASLLARPEIGSAPRFKKKKPKATYRYDSSLAPEMNWDGQNPAREHGEWLIACIEAAAKLGDADPPFTFKEPREFKSADGGIVASVRSLADATAQLKALSRPFLDWAGKAERVSFDVPTLPLFVHERLSTQAIVETLKSHRKDEAQTDMFGLFGDPKRPLADAITKAYEYQDNWVNRLILGDSLVVMNSLLRYEGMGGQVQTIYMDPPYGVKFGSNFQPFVRQKDVSADDADMTREPEMVKAYRDTWEFGLHSYLGYLRDRLALCRELLSRTGSVFLQISEENVSILKCMMDDIYGTDNFVAIIPFVKTSGLGASGLATVCDYIIWYARDKEVMKYNQLYLPRGFGDEGAEAYTWLLEKDGTRRRLSKQEKTGATDFPEGSRVYRLDNLTSGAFRENTTITYVYNGVSYHPGADKCWKTTKEGLDKLAKLGRLQAVGNTLAYVRFIDDFPMQPLKALWTDTGTGGYGDEKFYVVQTTSKVISRCVLMTSEPGDLVLDPTCGSGTTAYVAEHWGRRWITIDTSRVPLAIARQRVLSSTFPFFDLIDNGRGPAGGFRYERKVNKKHEEVGGVVPQVTLGGIANGEPAIERVIVDRPVEVQNITRVSGPFCVEATIPTPLDLDGNGEPDNGEAADDRISFVERMLDTLRRAPILQLGQGRTVTLTNIRPPAKTLALSAEALVEATSEGQRTTLADAIVAADEKNKLTLPLSQRPVAIVFGPESGAVSERLVDEAAREASAKRYTHLYVIGFAVQPNAENLIAQAEAIYDVPATYIAVTPDVVMGDLLKTTRASQIFSIAGRPEIELRKVAPKITGDAPRWQVRLLGLDTFDPVTMNVARLKGDDVPGWLLDADYNGRVFMGNQVFFPRTSAWENLKKALKATHEESVWDHLAGDTSAPFEAGENATIAVKVIDDRGNEMMVVKRLEEAGK